MLDFANESNWNQIHVSLREVTYIGDTSEFIPLTEFLLPEVYTGKYLRVINQNVFAKNTWFLGGRLTVRGNTPNINTPTNLKEPIIARYSVQVNNASIIEIPNYVDDYRLSFQSPYWFVYENLRIWEYIGQ